MRCAALRCPSAVSERAPGEKFVEGVNQVRRFSEGAPTADVLPPESITAEATHTHAHAEPAYMLQK